MVDLLISLHPCFLWRHGDHHQQRGHGTKRRCQRPLGRASRAHDPDAIKPHAPTTPDFAPELHCRDEREPDPCAHYGVVGPLFTHGFVPTGALPDGSVDALTGQTGVPTRDGGGEQPTLFTDTIQQDLYRSIWLQSIRACVAFTLVSVLVSKPREPQPQCQSDHEASGQVCGGGDTGVSRVQDGEGVFGWGAQHDVG
ncbi:hypothetical protein CPC16_006723, partial [Podila verticillata]